MTSTQAVLQVIRALDGLNIPYMVVGSFSSNAHGIERSTKDADLVIQVGDQPILELASRLGPAFKVDPQMSFETVTGTMRYIIEVRATRFRIELFLLSDEEHDQSRFARRQLVALPGFEGTAWVAAPEDVIITKLRWHRRKDYDDVVNVIAVSGHKLDWQYIERWADHFGIRPLLDRIRSETPEI